MPSDRTLRRYLKPLVFLAALLPLAWLLLDGLTGRLGANPVESITHRTGDWALRLLLLTLTLTPLRRLLGWGWLLRFRRMLGLYGFFYACLHVLAWVWLEQWFDWAAMLEDLLKRPYILLGMGAFGLMLPLAATSTRAAMRRLGRRWKVLHRLVYLVGMLAVLHFLWLTRANYLEPGVYAIILVAVLAMRLPLGPLFKAGQSSALFLSGGRLRR